MSDFADFSYLIPPEGREERERWLRAQEERIAAKTRQVLLDIIDRSTTRFTDTLIATGDMSAFDNIPVEWEQYVKDDLLTDLQGLFLSGGVASYMDAANVVLLAEDLATSWVSIVNQSAVEYALEASNRMKDVGQTAWNTIKNQVSKGIEQGTSPEALKRLIEKNKSFSEFRADTIARTETANAYNNGTWNSMNALGEYGPTHKYWISAVDNRSRPEHAAQHGKTLPLQQPFILGTEEVMYPHAPGISAKNSVNCRCEIWQLYPGQINPITGERVPDVVTPQPTVQQQPVIPTTTAPDYGFRSTFKVGGTTDFDELEVYLKETFEYRDKKTGFYTTTNVLLKEARRRGDPPKVIGTIYDSSGEKIGEFSRRIVGDGIEHVELVLLPGYQGMGFAQRFNARAEASYRRAGFKRISLEAGLDVGGYAWARQGYRLDLSRYESGQRGTSVDWIMRRFVDHWKFKGIDTETIARFKRLLEQGDMPSIAADPLGKDALLGTDWWGVKTL